MIFSICFFLQATTKQGNWNLVLQAADRNWWNVSVFMSIENHLEILEPDFYKFQSVYI